MTQVTRRDFVATTAAIAGASLVPSLSGHATPPAPAAEPIPLRPFGKTGERVTMIGLGGGSRFYEPEPDPEVSAEIVRQAIARGIRFIETASSYGKDGDSERRIGMALKTLRAQVFLETKVDGRDYDTAMREMETSLKRLNTDHLDLVLHHNMGRPDELDQVAAKDGAEAAIRKMVDHKVVRFRGFSCHIPQLTSEGIRRLSPDAIQIIVNATRVPSYESEVLPLARQKGVAVVVMKAVGKGYFLPANFTKPDRIDQYGPPAGVFDRNKNLPTARDYLWYALTLPVSTIVVGMDCMRTLEAVVQDVQGFHPLSAPEMASIADRAQVFRSTGFWLPADRQTAPRV